MIVNAAAKGCIAIKESHAGDGDRCAGVNRKKGKLWEAGVMFEGYAGTVDRNVIGQVW